MTILLKIFLSFLFFSFIQQISAEVQDPSVRSIQHWECGINKTTGFPGPWALLSPCDLHYFGLYGPPAKRTLTILWTSFLTIPVSNVVSISNFLHTLCYFSPLWFSPTDLYSSPHFHLPIAIHSLIEEISFWPAQACEVSLYWVPIIPTFPITRPTTLCCDLCV